MGDETDSEPWSLSPGELLWHSPRLFTTGPGPGTALPTQRPAIEQRGGHGAIISKNFKIFYSWPAGRGGSRSESSESVLEFDHSDIFFLLSELGLHSACVRLPRPRPGRRRHSRPGPATPLAGPGGAWAGLLLASHGWPGEDHHDTVGAFRLHIVAVTESYHCHDNRLRGHWPPRQNGLFALKLLTFFIRDSC